MRLLILSLRPVFVLCIPVLGLLLASCAEREQVRSYTVERVSERRATGPPPGRSAPSVQPQTAWFFKMLGPAAAVQERLDEFDQLLQSLTFGPDGTPDWELPEGWDERSESGIRFATLTVEESEIPLEVSVTALPAPDPGADEYIRANVERWRGQLGLDGYSESDWRDAAESAGELEDLSTDDANVLRVNLAGATADHPEARMLAAIAWPDAASGAAPPSSPSQPDEPLTYDVPPEWQREAPGAFQMALFSVSESGETAQASISRAGGDLAANVNRWRGQIGLPAASADEMADLLEAIEVGGRPAMRVMLRGEEQSIRAVVVPDTGANWFFKLMGPSDLVEREAERFDAFVQSVEFTE